MPASFDAADVVVEWPRDRLFSTGLAHNVGWKWVTDHHPDEAIYFHQADYLAPVALPHVEWATSLQAVGFCFPYWGEVHLSESLSAVLRKKPDARAALADAAAKWVSDYRSKNKLRLEQAVDRIHHEALTPRLLNHLAQKAIERADSNLPDNKTDQRPYRQFQSTATHHDVTVFSGPRSSGGYFASPAAYGAVGGVPMLKGWGYEDLTFWRKVQHVLGFATTEYATTIGDHAQTTSLPLLHLHHEVDATSEYYSSTPENEQYFRALGDLNDMDFTNLMSAQRKELHELAQR